MNIKKLLAIACFSITSTYTAKALAAEIPKEFQGQWGANKKECNPKAAESSNAITVTAKLYNSYESSCALKAIKASSPTKLEGIFTCSVEGENSQDNIKMELTDGGKAMSVGETKLIKCK